ncbi:GNAT family N-acetyltransferase [Sandaracinus amylolyticus]|uniref:GNAT family N-acetyltransferase n=1 Tax=Sandaracinus amylolyticus TaxID=927083 RepID=UPI001F39B91A|nr:GNAT family N-acetyltransferase [Sandaracinus amylolyticus]UJR84331.1 Hypothetical protein I5071_64100 [Sandaracinus amylolyticus]
MIRLARHGDVGRLQAIEVAAGEPFRALGMDRIADDDPPDAAALEERIDAGLVWVVADAGDVACAYLVASSLRESLHIQQLSVHPTFARKRLGASLVEHLERWAMEHGFGALSLTTFRDVPWNAPYYARLGFELRSASELPADLAAIRRREAELDLDAWPRVVMTKRLTSDRRR